jgi:O-antigen/teichoic acid export membrane protein
MTRLLGVVGIYGLMLLGWTVVGIFMLVAPARFGNAIHESFGLFPAVSSRDTGKKLLVRAGGLALLGFAARFALGVSRVLS